LNVDENLTCLHHSKENLIRCHVSLNHRVLSWNGRKLQPSEAYNDIFSPKMTNYLANGT